MMPKLGIPPDDSAEESGSDELEEMHIHESNSEYMECEKIAEYVSDKHPYADTLKRILNESQYNVFELVKYSDLSIECVEDLLKTLSLD